jgi:hypothetical protein
MTVDFQSDGVSSTTIRLVAMHNNNGTEKIIGFDNVMLIKETPDAIRKVQREFNNNRWYDLQGRNFHTPYNKGLYVLQGKKMIVK